MPGFVKFNKNLKNKLCIVVFFHFFCCNFYLLLVFNYYTFALCDTFDRFGMTVFAAILFLKDKAPGTFVVRDSNSFPGAFGLALKVQQVPANVMPKGGTCLSISNSLQSSCHIKLFHMYLSIVTISWIAAILLCNVMLVTWQPCYKNNKLVSLLCVTILTSGLFCSISFVTSCK